MILKSIQKYLSALRHLVFPKVCMACDRVLYEHENVLCTFCLVQLPKTDFHLQKDNPVHRLFWGKAEVENAASFFYFNKGGDVQRLMHRFKYKGFKEIGFEVGKNYGSDLKDSPLFSSVDVIIPVPLHPSKKRKRGYNQSEWFASGLAESMSVPADFTSLYRSKATETQTKKSRYDRFENVENIFRIQLKSPLEGKHVLLVDDVVTTGSTLEACCNALKNIKNVKVSVVTMAYAA